MSALLDSLTAPFDTLPLRDAAGLAASRRDAIDALRRDGLPGPRVEAWKYTSLRPLERRSFAAAVAGLHDPAWIAGIPAPRIVFVNGHHASSLSDLAGLAGGVSVEPLSSVIERGESIAFDDSSARADRPFAH